MQNFQAFAEESEIESMIKMDLFNEMKISKLMLQSMDFCSLINDLKLENFMDKNE